LHKHHLIIRVGAGLIQFVYRSHLRLATEVTRNRNAFSPFFAQVLSKVSEQFVGSYVISPVLTIRLIKGLSWVFATQEKKKESLWRFYIQANKLGQSD